MASRYSSHTSTLHNRDNTRTHTPTLFDAYTGDNDVDQHQRKEQQQQRRMRMNGDNPNNNNNKTNGRGGDHDDLFGRSSRDRSAGGGGVGYGYNHNNNNNNGGYGGYRGGQAGSAGYSNVTGGSMSASTLSGGGGGYRPATPNSRGQYSDAVLSSLESQNDAQIEGLSGKVKMLKDITLAIGDEIRDSTALAEKMNDQFDHTRSRIKGTMNRMLRMAQRTGVGWKIWALFFVAVVGLFVWVWLF